MTQTRVQSGEGNYALIYRMVKRIPRGRVATYGQIARLAGLVGHARQVGYALNATPENVAIPWQRVINAQGMVSPRTEPGAENEQRTLLEAEGIEFSERGRISLVKYQWRPRGE